MGWSRRRMIAGGTLGVVGIIAGLIATAAPPGVLTRRSRRNDSSGLAPEIGFDEAALQVWGAAVYGWRGIVADHTWIAAKRPGSDRYLIYQVLGWRLRRGLGVVSIEAGIADRHWWGAPPRLFASYRGPAALDLLDPVHDAAMRYPFDDQYVMWPGPNSNSFTAWIGLEVPGLDVNLPFRAFGKNWMVDNYPVA